MGVIVGLELVALVIAIGLGTGLLVSLAIGLALTRSPSARVLAPVFVSLVPFSMAGALVGFVGVGYLALRLNDSAIVLGAITGLVLGGLGGFAVGTFVALRCSRSARR